MQAASGGSFREAAIRAAEAFGRPALTVALAFGSFLYFGLLTPQWSGEYGYLGVAPGLIIGAWTQSLTKAKDWHYGFLAALLPLACGLGIAASEGTRLNLLYIGFLCLGTLAGLQLLRRSRATHLLGTLVACWLLWWSLQVTERRVEAFLTLDGPRVARQVLVPNLIRELRNGIFKPKTQFSIEDEPTIEVYRGYLTVTLQLRVADTGTRLHVEIGEDSTDIRMLDVQPPPAVDYFSKEYWQVLSGIYWQGSDSWMIWGPGDELTTTAVNTGPLENPFARG